MAFDGAFLHTVMREIKCAELSRVEKIYQPYKDELVLHLKKKDFSSKLHVSVRNGSGRIGFTNDKFENPAAPPMFCMLARKVFSSAWFISAEQKGLERVIELNFQAVNEMGDITEPKIICEFIAGSNNIILCDENGKILDALSRSDITANRIIMPGAVYTYPEGRGKLSILDTKTEKIISEVKGRGGKVADALLGVLDGFSPLVCREIAFSAFGRTDIETVGADLTALTIPLENCRRALTGEAKYTALYENGVPKEFSFIDINQYGGFYQKKQFSSAGEMLNEFYYERDKAARLKKQSGDILRAVNNLLSRAKRRKALREKDLYSTKDRENLRVKGELIKANIHAIKTGDMYCDVQNFYDENLKTIRIKLDPALSPAANAAKYFKNYKKSCVAFASLGDLIEQDTKEIDYLDSVLDSIERARGNTDIAEIRQELQSAGYLRGKSSARKQNSVSQIEQYKSEEGYKIFVGHNNIQNDYITTRLADKNDMWFHTKNIHGSHVIVKSGGNELSENTVLYAAKLAAENSRAKNSSKVPVDYTPVKYVKKPAGAKAGMVVYTTNKTVFVTPWED
ncbi:MAG: NFACT family protein [Clostridia bacterium]|nr:NFACT family protein [Clostridia bacterium]